ncbi:MAG: hypothetical protein N3A54_04315 [Patescibacteria group bacterium]|nr:hypothetical protein [Patescibacteria group bacterium]
MSKLSLSQRQIEILRAVIEEYIKTAEPVGSETIEKKYDLGVSPATIRNEMARLAQLGLLHQPHASAGRSPTPVALRYYVDTLMKPKSVSIAEEVSVKERVWDYRREQDKFLREITRILAQKTRVLAFTTTEHGDMYYSGVANILGMPEFFDYNLTFHLFECLDQYNFWWEILESRDSAFDVLLGESLNSRSFLAQCGIIYYKFFIKNTGGAIGVIGPFRLNYPYVVPVVKSVGRLIMEIGNQ